MGDDIILHLVATTASAGGALRVSSKSVKRILSPCDHGAREKRSTRSDHRLVCQFRRKQRLQQQHGQLDAVGTGPF
jgi:hypothetical protein